MTTHNRTQYFRKYIYNLFYKIYESMFNMWCWHRQWQVFIYLPSRQIIVDPLMSKYLRRNSENVPSDMSTQRKLKSACASVQSDQSSLSPWRNLASLAIQNALSEDSDQTAHLRSLIRIFAGRTCPKFYFLMLRLTSSIHVNCNTPYP